MHVCVHMWVWWVCGVGAYMYVCVVDGGCVFGVCGAYVYMYVWVVGVCLVCVGVVCALVCCVSVAFIVLFIAGVFNVVTGDGQFGSTLANHSDVDKVGFTGSTEVSCHTPSIVSHVW